MAGLAELCDLKMGKIEHKHKTGQPVEAIVKWWIDQAIKVIGKTADDEMFMFDCLMENIKLDEATNYKDKLV